MDTPQLADTQPDDAPKPGTRWAGVVTAFNRKRLLTAAAVSLVATGTLGLIVVNVPNESRSQPVQNSAKPASFGGFGPSSPYPPDVAQERACGAIAVIGALTNDSIDPEPYPGKATPPPDGDVIIGYANALNHVERQGLSDTMNASITAHVYALTNLGAMINHHADHEDIGSMAIVVDTTAAVLHELCNS